MHVALIIDDERLEHEQPMLNRLCIGLMAEGAQVTRIVPDTRPADPVDEGEQRIALATRLETPLKVLPWMRQWRVQRLVERLTGAPPDVLHAVGRATWPLASDLGRALDRPVLLDVCSLEQARAAGQWQATARADVSGYVTPCRPLEAALAQVVDPGLISVVPMGVPVPSEPRTILADPGQAIGIAVIGGARDLPAYHALFAALRRLTVEHHAVQIFLELRGPLEHDVWRKAERMELLPLVSSIDDASLYRSLLTRCDLLVAPEALGEVRSLVLEAMSLGMAIACAPDPVQDMLVDGRTAVFAERMSESRWFEALRGLIANAGHARSLGMQARQAVIASHRSSQQVAAFIGLLERVSRGGALAFTGGGNGRS